MIKILFGLMAIIVTMVSPAFAEESFGIATGSKGFTYYKIGQEIQQSCPNLPIEIYESTGSVSNISNVYSSQNIRYGISQIDALLFKSLTNKKQTDNIMVIYPLFDDELHLLARVDSGINSLSGLTSRRVNEGPLNSGTFVTANLVKLKTGTKWVGSNYDQKEALKKLLSGEIDAMFYTGGKPIQPLVDLGKNVDGIIKLVSVSHPSLDSFYTPIDIPEGLYPWQGKPVTTYAIKNVLIGFNYKSPQRQKEIKDLVTCITENLSQMQETGHPKWREIDPFDRSAKWPMHKIADKTIRDLMQK